MKKNSHAARTSEHTQVDAELSDNACIAANLMDTPKVSMVSYSVAAGIIPEGYTVESYPETCPHYGKLLDPRGKFVRWLSERPLTRKMLLRLLKKCIIEGCRAGFLDPVLAREALESFRAPEASVLSNALRGLAENCTLQRAALSEVAACQ